MKTATPRRKVKLLTGSQALKSMKEAKAEQQTAVEVSPTDVPNARAVDVLQGTANKDQEHQETGDISAREKEAKQGSEPIEMGSRSRRRSKRPLTSHERASRGNGSERTTIPNKSPFTVPRRPPSLAERSVRFTTYLDKDVHAHVERLHQEGTIVSKKALVNVSLRSCLSTAYGISL